MRNDQFYVAQPGEQIWDHSNRILSIALIEGMVHFVGDAFGKGREANHCFATYMQSFTKTKASLSELLASRSVLHKLIRWEEFAPGEYRTQVLSQADTHIMDAAANSAAAFAGFVISWQPLMDSIAATTAAILSSDATKLPNDMRRLSKWAARAEAEHSTRLRETLTTRVEWYVNNVRVMRNRFVHNERVAHLMPEAGSEHTVVTIKKLERDETEESFRLDPFLGWTFTKLLLFAVSLDKALIEVQSR